MLSPISGNLWKKEIPSEEVVGQAIRFRRSYYEQTTVLRRWLPVLPLVWRNVVGDMLHQNTSFFYGTAAIVTQVHSVYEKMQWEHYSSQVEIVKFSQTTTLDYTFKNFILEVPVLNTLISGRTDLHAIHTLWRVGWSFQEFCWEK